MYPLSQLAQIVGGQLDGPPELVIRGVAPFEEAQPGEISMAAEERYLKAVASCRASALLVGEDVGDLGLPVIRVANPRLAFIALLEAFAPRYAPQAAAVHPTAVLGDGVTLGEGVSVAPYVTVGEGTRIGKGVTLHAGVRIGRDVVIGDYTVVYPNAVIYDRTEIGARVIVHAGAVIGSDGYGFVSTAEGHRKVPHIGHVQIGDDVEIGAGVTIDRATCGATRIGRGTKIGNLSQVAHNVQIGEDCLIVGMAGLAGSCRIGNRVTIAGQAGIVGHIQVGDRAVVGAQSMVSKDVPPGAFVDGTPARDLQENLRTVAASRKLPELVREMRHLKKRLEELEAQLVREGAPLGEAED
ncbi:MAG: UDP-3-O-(3-hydroxymyristoyl)glucosamine N-acyltransferase [Firmicutes bacterium]|nr:UDP-3-O-(3-hydroxymyristoyl)glucosamine N-acyltransferase [Bacillota bacterium]